MASNPQRLGDNFGNRSIKVPALRLSDEPGRNTRDYAEILTGDGAPSGGYGRDGGVTMLYFRKDASSVGTALYVTVNGGTNWTAMDPAVLSTLDLNGSELILDADGNTSITADTDNQIDIRINGADDFRFVANIFRALSGSSIETDTLNETTSGSGITADSLLIKDGGIETADSAGVDFGADADIRMRHNGSDSVIVDNAASGTMGFHDDVLNIVDPSDVTKALRIDAGEVTAGQVRVISPPDQNVGADQFIMKATGTISAAALRTLNATPVTMIAAPGSGKYIKVLWVHWFLDYGGVQMDAAASGDTLNAKYTNGSGAAVVDAVAGDTIGGVTADYHTTVFAVPEVVPVVNAAIVAHIATGEWYSAAGTSELKFVAYYQVVTLPT